MSEGYIRLIPTDKRWQPTPEAAEAAVRYVARLFSGPGDGVERVDAEFYDEITLIDAGECTTRITCSRCDGDIEVLWFFELGEVRGVPDVRVPCCGATVALDSLRYDWPVGFARFEVCAVNATRATYELDDAELADVAALLGHPVAQILAHY